MNPQAPAVAPAPPSDEPTWFRCGLCGHRFSHDGQSCTRCPLATGCDVVECPNCGFQFPRSSRIVDWLRRLLRRPRSGG